MSKAITFRKILHYDGTTAYRHDGASFVYRITRGEDSGWVARVYYIDETVPGIIVCGEVAEVETFDSLALARAYVRGYEMNIDIAKHYLGRSSRAIQYAYSVA